MMKRNKKLQRLVAMFAGLAILLATGNIAWAHPLGNFTISRYSELTAGDDTLSLLYVIDMAEIPTFQERPLIDSDGDGAISSAESAAYRDQLAAALLANLALEINGEPSPWTLESATLAFPPGQGGLETMRLELVASAALPNGAAADIAYQDNNYSDRLGWREIVMTSTSGELAASSVPSSSVSDRLHNYPADLLQAPMDVTSAEARFVPSGVAAPDSSADGTTTAVATAAAAASRFSSDEFGNLLSRTMDTPGAFAAVLALAVVLGAAHALTPGHGKTIVGAYLVGSRGTAKHAVLLGLTTTVTHTAGVFALGLIVLVASRYIVPEKLFPWLGLASGLMVAAIGFTILRGHISHWRAYRASGAKGADNYHFHFGFGHSHTAETHSHKIALSPAQTVAPGRKLVLASGSMSTGHDHDSGHAHAQNSSHAHDDSHAHDHVPAALTSGEPISLRGLLALGVSGGLIPCPSALVLLLSAVALGQVATGLVLILAFSAGLAGVLTAIGITMVYAGKALDRMPVRHSVVTQRLLPIASATFITIAGSVIAVRALLEMKLL